MGAFFEALVNHSDRIFSAILNRAVAATLLILAVCVYRALSPKAPKWTRLFLWALAGLRLCLPFSIQSAWSLVPSEKILDYETAQYAAKPEITSGIAALNQAVNPAFGESFAATPAASVNPLQVWMHLAGIVWAIGVLALLLAALVSVWKLRRRVQASIELTKGVRLCDAIDTPFLLGLFRPTVYLPSQLSQQERDVVLAHEAAHKTHGDCIWKLLGYGILCAYWFYLPVWLGYALFCRDLELACDERAVKRLSLEEKKRYASVLLSCSVPRGSFPVCPLAFGEVGVKERVKRVLDKKPAKALIALALAVCLVIGVCFLTAKQDAADLRSVRRQLCHGRSGCSSDSAVAGNLPDVRQPSRICIYAQSDFLLLYGGRLYNKRRPRNLLRRDVYARLQNSGQRHHRSANSRSRRSSYEWTLYSKRDGILL